MGIIHTSGIMVIGIVASVVAYAYLSLAEYEEKREKSDRN